MQLWIRAGPSFVFAWLGRGEGKGREGKGREGKGREGKGREGKGREGKGREGKGRGREGKGRKGREGKGREGKGREGKGREGKGREGKGRGGKGRGGKGVHALLTNEGLGEAFDEAGDGEAAAVSRPPEHHLLRIGGLRVGKRKGGQASRQAHRGRGDAAHHLLLRKIEEQERPMLRGPHLCCADII